MVKLIIEHGGLVLLPIVVTSLVALAVTCERLWRLLPLGRIFIRTRNGFHDALLRGGAAQAAAALDDRDPLSRVLLAGLGARTRGPDAMRLAALDAAQREVPVMERGLGILLAATQVAPLMGLLGTVFGLINAFQAVAATDQAVTGALAAGIYKALTTTAAGLIVAIPAFLAYGTLSGMVGRLVEQLEHTATDLPTVVGDR